MESSGQTYEPVAAKMMTKRAAGFWPAVGKLLAGGAGAVGMDRLTNGDWVWEASNPSDMRVGNMVMNTGLGYLSAHQIAKGRPVEGVLVATSMPAKDVLLNALPSLSRLPKTLDAIAEGQDAQAGAAAAGPATAQDWATAGAIGLAGLGALGLGGYGLYKWLEARDEDKVRDSRMKMRIKTPNGDDAVVDMPLVNPSLSDTLEEEFNRGVTRAVRQTARYNSHKRDPLTGRLISYKQWQDKYGAKPPAVKAARVGGVPRRNLLEGTAPQAVERKAPVGPAGPAALAAAGMMSDPSVIKTAAGRERKVNEAVGSVTAPALAALLAGGTARMLGAGTAASILSAGAGAAFSPLLGMAMAAKAPDRAQTEQDNIDANGTGWANLVVPGLAQYNALRRARAVPDQVAVAERLATGEPMPDLDGDGEPDRLTINETARRPMPLDDDMPFKG